MRVVMCECVSLNMLVSECCPVAVSISGGDRGRLRRGFGGFLCPSEAMVCDKMTVMMHNPSGNEPSYEEHVRR